MGSFGIAFDTIVVGALALPWIFLVIHLFFPENEGHISSLLDWVNKQNQPAVAGLLLFAMAYPLGSVVSRIAQDCFDDDDLYVEALGRVFRMGVDDDSDQHPDPCLLPGRRSEADLANAHRLPQCQAQTIRDQGFTLPI